MAQATGPGGVVLRARAPEAVDAWYAKHLGLPKGEGSFALPAERQRADIAFAFFPQASQYFPTGSRS